MKPISIIPKDMNKILQFKNYYPTHTTRETMMKFGWSIHVVNHFRDKYKLRKTKRAKSSTKRIGVGTVLEQEPLNYCVLDFDWLDRAISKACGEVIHQRAGRNYNTKSIEAKNNSMKK